VAPAQNSYLDEAQQARDPCLYNGVYIRFEAGTQNNNYYIGLYATLFDGLVLTESLPDTRGVRPEINAFLSHAFCPVIFYAR